MRTIIKIFGLAFIVTSCLVPNVYSNDNVKHKKRLAQKNEARLMSENTFLELYFNLKDTLSNQLGLELGIDVSYTAQRAAPSGKQTAIQGIYYPYLTWTFFKEAAAGGLQLNFNYNLARYWGPEAATLQDRVSVASAFNDYATRQNIFSQLTLTYTLPGQMSWLSFTAGQFPMYNFDGGTYLNNQQTYLMNYALSQNASSSYPSASLGAYMQAQVNERLSVGAGYQDATNVLGDKIQFDTAFDGAYAGFGSMTYTPEIAGLGPGNYLALLYYQPSTDLQPGESWGWSFIAEQHLTERLVLFGGFNGISAQTRPIRQSYRAGVAYLDPFNRGSQDAVTFGAAYNHLSKTQFTSLDMKTGETVLEAQYVYWPVHWLSLTPDVQVYPIAAQDSSKKWVTVASLRVNLSL